MIITANSGIGNIVPVSISLSNILGVCHVKRTVDKNAALTITPNSYIDTTDQSKLKFIYIVVYNIHYNYNNTLFYTTNPPQDIILLKTNRNISLTREYFCSNTLAKSDGTLVSYNQSQAITVNYTTNSTITITGGSVNSLQQFSIYFLG